MKNFPTTRHMSCHCVLNTFLQYLTQQNLICCFLKQCDLNRQIWRDKFQLEFLFRKTPAVQVKQTQEVKRFKGLYYSVNSFSNPFLWRVYPYARKIGYPQTQWILLLFQYVGPTSIEGAINPFRIREMAMQVQHRSTCSKGLFPAVDITPDLQ